MKGAEEPRGRVQRIPLTRQKQHIKLQVDIAIYDAVKTCAELEGMSAASFFIQGAVGRMQARHKIEFIAPNKTMSNTNSRGSQGAAPTSSGVAFEPVTYLMKALDCDRPLAEKGVAKHTAEHVALNIVHAECPLCRRLTV
jgi:hypothetical protein